MDVVHMNKKKLKLFTVITEIPIFIYFVTLVFPFLWILLNSFKTSKEFFNDIWSLPKNFSFDNYINAWIDSKMYQYYLNSIIISTIATFTSVLLAAIVAYVLSKYKFRGRNFVYALSIAGFFIPQVGSLAPFYIFMKNAGLFNQVGLLLLYSGGMGTGMIILYSFFKNIPWDFAEAEEAREWAMT